MDSDRFDALARRLAIGPSRRGLLGGFAGGALGLVAGRLPGTVEAKKRHKHKKKTRKAKPNAFGCLSVDKTCKSAEQCCSGICEGKKGKKCRAHGTGTCSQKAQDFCASPAEQTLCNDSPSCACFRTTAGSNFCVGVGTGVSDCADCKTDADCAALGFPPGSACAPFTAGVCAGMCEGNMACVVPCGFEPPEA